MKTPIEKFFMPSSELTQSLSRRMREEALGDLQHSIDSAGGLNPENSDANQPWTVLLKTDAERHQTPKEIAADQRWFSEILYGYLARLAQSEIQPESESFSAVEAIPAGMSSRLGLDDTEDLKLLEELATEFQQWLAGCRGLEFAAGWGTIWLDPGDRQRFGLNRFQTPVEQEYELSKAAASSNAFSAGVGSPESWFARLLRSDRS